MLRCMLRCARRVAEPLHSTVVLLVLLLVVCWPLSAAAQQASGTAEAPVASSSPAASSAQLQVTLPIRPEQLLQSNVLVCRWCDLDYCGCIALSYCVLLYSCVCSSIDCEHTCVNVDCKL
jgi:hypothetical protein